MTATLRTRPADAAADLGRIRAVLERNLPEASPAERLEWLYASNPCGAALAWVSEREGSGEPVATSAAHRRLFRIGGKDAFALNLSDFAIDAEYRTLGPALGLLRATLNAVAAGGYAFSYDVPSESMLALYRRLGAVELGRFERRVRPLSLRPALERRIGPLARVLAVPFDVALRVRDALQATPKDLEVAPLEGAFGPEFDALEDTEKARFRVRGARTAAYLSWRYARHTMWPHFTLCARQAGALKGFLVYRATGGTLLISELVDGGDLGVARSLVKALLKIGRQHGATSLSVETLARSPASARFAELGFVNRGDGPGPVVHLGTLPPDLADPRHWWFVGGDRDI